MSRALFARAGGYLKIVDVVPVGQLLLLK